MEYLISIIVPVYNDEKYLRNALESIINQTIGLEHLEVIMVNDCSTDKSGKIIEEYASKYENFKAIHLDENSGAAGKPRNIGIEKATGKYLMFLDHDDYYTPDACETLYKKIAEENVDIVFSNYIYVFENGTQKNYGNFGEGTEVKVKTIDEEPLLLTIPPSVWTKIYKRNFILDKGIKFKGNIPNEDLVFVLNTFFEANGIIYLKNHFSYNFRISDKKGNESLSRQKSMENLMRMTTGYKQTFNILKEYGKEEYFSTLFKGHLQFWADNLILSDASSYEKKELLKEIGFLYEEFSKFDSKLDKPYLNILFNVINNREYDTAVLIIESLKVTLLTQKKLETEIIELKNELNKNKIETAGYLSIIGYLKYKIKNVSSRIENKIKKSYITKKLLKCIDNNYIKIIIQKLNPFFNYNKVTFILPYRESDDPDRSANLEISLRYLNKIGVKNLIISEHADVSSEKFLIKNYKNLFDSFNVIFNNADGKLFNKSQAINKGVIQSKTPYIVIMDIDCLTKKKNIDQSLKLLNKGYDIVHPFDKRVTDIVDKENFKKSYDFDTVKSPEQNRPWADGGIVFWNKNSFISIGMKNEYFSGWGGEDNEIMIRANICQLKTFRINDTLYHLYHHRPQIRTQNNIEQLEKTKQMKNRYGCLKEVNKWPWVIKAKKDLDVNKKDVFINKKLLKNYPIYILFNKKNFGLKNLLINIKGYNIIKQKNLFEKEYYLKNNPDVKVSGMDPLLHYIYYGFKEGRKPNPSFDGDYYLKTNLDVKKSNLNPLIHYSLYGIKENRNKSNK